MSYIDISILRVLLYLLVVFADLVRFHFNGVEILGRAMSNALSKLCAGART
jgi:hypothetical protein